MARLTIQLKNLGVYFPTFFASCLYSSWYFAFDSHSNSSLVNLSFFPINCLLQKSLFTISINNPELEWYVVSLIINGRVSFLHTIFLVYLLEFSP